MRKWTLKQKYSPSLIAAVIAISIFVVVKVTHYRFPQLPWYPPVSWGLPKEIFIDPIIVFVFAWDGWVFLLPLLVGFCCKSSYKTLFGVFALTSIAMGILGTFFNFSHYSVYRFIEGIVSYSIIFGAISIYVFIIKIIFSRIFK